MRSKNESVSSGRVKGFVFFDGEPEKRKVATQIMKVLNT